MGSGCQIGGPIGKSGSRRLLAPGGLWVTVCKLGCRPLVSIVTQVQALAT
jgi:hypothetical protein